MAKRFLHQIASEIYATWPVVNPYAKAYLANMARMGTINDDFMGYPADEIVLRFLDNASGWRGEHARRIKAELNSMLKEVA